MDETALREAAERWIAGDPDPATRETLRSLLATNDVVSLDDHVGGALTFGTAGIRGEVGPGPRRMNRAVVIRTTAGLVQYLRQKHGDVTAGPVVVGHDARVDSPAFAADTVGVLAAAGFDVLRFDAPVATPLVAYAAKILGAVAAVVVTASHNPPRDNGYKVYGGNAAQIVPPTDAEIAAAIHTVGPANEVPRVAPSELADHPRVGAPPADLFPRYLTDLASARPPRSSPAALSIVYTPLHGVGRDPVLAALRDAGYDDVVVVPEQGEPDGTFPTVAFPNPEEPGALDLALALATERDADIVLANDPDVDRLAVCIREGRGFRRLHGNEIGVLLLDHLLANDPAVGGGGKRLVVSSIVSTPMAADIARAHDARHETTLTGFKWICAAALSLAEQGWRFVAGFEEALGYTVGDVVRDKDGIGALVAFADLAANVRSRGGTLAGRLDDLRRQHGLWVSHQHAVMRPGVAGQEEIAAAMELLRRARPGELAGLAVRDVTDYRDGADVRPPWLGATPLVELTVAAGDGEPVTGRVLVRPSGTEPKLKIYVDLRGEVGSDELDVTESSLRDRAAAAGEAMAGFLGLA